MTTAGCSHIDTIVADIAPSSNGCEDCLRVGFEIASMIPSPAHT